MSDINPSQVSFEKKHVKKSIADAPAAEVVGVAQDTGTSPAEQVAGETQASVEVPAAATVESAPVNSVETQVIPAGTTIEAQHPVAQEEPKKEESAQEPKEDNAEDALFDKEGFTADGVAKKVLESLADTDLGINQVAIVNALDEAGTAEKLSKLYPTDKEFEKATEDPTSFWNLFTAAGSNGWNYNHLRDFITTLIDNKVEKKLERIKNTEFADKTANKINTSAVDVTGIEAMNAFMSAVSGFLKVNLMNSGFWVTLRRPQIIELQGIFDSLELEQKEIGYMVGAHFALCADVYLKRKFIEALIDYRIINGSNLEGIYKDDNFAQAVSYLDYETLVHAVLTLMSRSKGLRTRVACPNCRKIDLVEDIDIGSCKVINRDLITDEVRAWWAQTKDAQGRPIKRTLKDVKKYQNEILKPQHSFIEKFSNNNLDTPRNIRLNLRVPTMAEYFEDGALFANKLNKLIDERDVGSSERRKIMAANLGAHLFQMITPWVRNIEMLDDEGKVAFRTADRDPIMMILDTTTQDKDEAIKPLKEIEAYTASTKFVWIGMFSMECPHCHSKPDFGLDQFFPLEVQTIFFGHLYRVLPEEITRMQMDNQA